MTRMARVLALLVVLVWSSTVLAGGREVELRLTIRPELELKGTERIFVGPVLLEPRGGADFRRVDINAVREFERYVRKMLRRRTRLTLLEPAQDLRPPSEDINELATMTWLWAGTNYGAASKDIKNFHWYPGNGGGPYLDHPERWTK